MTPATSTPVSEAPVAPLAREAAKPDRVASERAHVDRPSTGRAAGASARTSVLIKRAGAGAGAFFKIIRDLFRYNREFALGAFLTGIVIGMAVLSPFSPYTATKIYAVAPDVAPSWAHPFGTNSRGQDVFWQLTYAIRNTLLFGFAVAILSRLISLFVGLLSGYKGGLTDRVLMSINDTFIVIPLFPLLILFYFVMRDYMNWALLALVMACLGWAYDARLIRSLMMSLKTREFTRTSVFSGMKTHEIVVSEHLPYVLPIVFSTTLNNINWSIGLEVTLSVLGFTNIDTPTVGTMIFWANQHSAMVSGVWWWFVFPTLFITLTFIGLFLLAVSMNEYIDPRSRLSRMGGGVG
jgi:peptide/nickel transport system permease protein